MQSPFLILRYFYNEVLPCALEVFGIWCDFYVACALSSLLYMMSIHAINIWKRKECVLSTVATDAILHICEMNIYMK